MGGKNLKVNILPIIQKIIGSILLLTTIIIKQYQDLKSIIIIILLFTIYIMIFYYDLKFMIIPDILNIMIILISLFTTKNFMGVLIQDIQYGIIFFLSMTLIIIFIEKYSKRSLIGGGDLKFFLSNVLIFGLTRSLLAIFIASIIGVVIEGLLIKRETKEFPFGPYLVIGYIIVLFMNKYILMF